METIICKDCNQSKDVTNFFKDKSRSNGYDTRCKVCQKIWDFNKYRSPKGVLRQMYHSQVKSSKKRGHKPPEYTKEELVSKYVNNSEFLTLFSAWKNSGWNRNLVPSLDRIDESMGYSFSNTQLTTLEKNLLRQWEASRIAVQCIDELGNLKTFPSQVEASTFIYKDKMKYYKIVKSIKEGIFVEGFKWSYHP